MQRKLQKESITSKSYRAFDGYATKNPKVIYWLACNLGAAIVSLVPLPWAGYAGAAMASGTNVGFAVAAASTKRTNELERAQSTDRSRFERDMKRLELGQTELAQDKRKHELNENRLIAFQAQLKTKESTMHDRITAQAEKDAQRVAQLKLDEMQARLDKALGDKAAMQATYQEKSTQMAKSTTHIVGKVQKAHKELGDTAASALSTSNQVLADERQQVNRVLENLGRDIKAMSADLAAQKELVAKLQAPKQFRFKSFEADTANEIQSFLMTRGVVLSCDRIGKVHYGLTPIYFESINCDLDAVKKQLEAVQLALGLSELPIAEIDSGKIKMTIQLSQDKTAKPAKDIVIVDPPLSKLEDAINDSIHLRIVAQSGSGKTVLLGNLINYLVSNVSSDYVLSDPKVTAPENWGNLKPSYYSRNCLQHFFGLTETCVQRIDKAAESVEAGNGMPNFEIQFHVIDELEFLYGLAEVANSKELTPKLFKINAKSMLKTGREHKMKLLFVTQSPLPSDINLRKNDFENCSSIFLGSQISAGLNSTDSEGLLKDVPNEKIAQLKAEYKARCDRGDKWIYLFFNPSDAQNPFMGRCPSPGHYAELLGQNELSQYPDSEGVAHVHKVVGKTRETTNAKGGAGFVGVVGVDSGVGKNGADCGEDLGLSQRLAQGTHCPDCGHHSCSYKNKKPRGNGKVSVKCTNKKCTTHTFSWKVI